MKNIEFVTALRTIKMLCGVAVLFMMGCQYSSPRHSSSHQSSGDTTYTEAKAMSFHLNNPERAFVMIDSAVIVGNISWERGEYLKAITQYGGLHNIALSRQTCLNLIKSAPTDSSNLENVYTLLVAIENTSSNYPAVIRYATEASRLAHALDKPVDIYKMEDKIAYALAETGKTDEGIGRMRNTMDELRQIDSFKGITAYHDVSKSLLHILLNHKRHKEMVNVCEEVLQRLDELARHPEKFDGMAKGFDPAEFIDHARGQTLAFLTTAYARQYTAAKEPPMEVTPVVRAQLLQKARMAEAEMFKTKWSKTLDCDRMMTAAYHHLGEFERFDKGNARLDSLITDTISNNYLIRLRLRSTAANMRGRLEEAINYMSRAEIIHDSLDKRNQSEQLSELATLYHLQEEQLSRQQAEAEAERSHIINIALAAGLLAALAFLLWFFHQKHIVEKKNQVLAREISESIKYREMLGRGAGGETVGDGVSNPSNLSDKELFAFLRENIMRDQLYLDPQLDRQSLVDRFALSKERIGSAFAKGSPYKSLIDFLTDCRLPYAAKLLTDRPDLSIADVARESGFPTLNTFGRNFKQKYALTPSQFREQQVK